MPVWASKASESDSPVLTRLETSSSCAEKLAFFWILPSICSEPRIGRPGPDQGEELLVEDQEWLQLDLAALHPAQQPAARLDREDVVAGVGKARAQLLGGGRRLHLLLHAAPLIGQA